MYRSAYELRNLLTSKEGQFITQPTDVSSNFKGQDLPEPPKPEFLGPELWDSLLTLSDIDEINLEEFSPSVLHDNENLVQHNDSNYPWDNLLPTVDHNTPSSLSGSVGASTALSGTYSLEPSTPADASITSSEEVADCNLASIDTGRKCRKRQVPSEMKDEKYWARRLRNNASAKRSRDARRLKESQIGVRAAMVDRENQELKLEISRLTAENRLLRQQLAAYVPSSLPSHTIHSFSPH